jgi:hypothetical protein
VLCLPIANSYDIVREYDIELAKTCNTNEENASLNVNIRHESSSNFKSRTCLHTDDNDLHVVQVNVRDVHRPCLYIDVRNIFSIISTDEICQQHRAASNRDRDQTSQSCRTIIFMIYIFLSTIIDVSSPNEPVTNS